MKLSSRSEGHQDSETQATSGLHGGADKASTEDPPRLDEIRIRAYEIYIERDGQPGDELSDWLQAKREIESKGRSNS